MKGQHSNTAIFGLIYWYRCFSSVYCVKAMPQYVCPAPSQNPIEVFVSDPFTFAIQQSDKSILCNLFKVTLNEGGDLNSFSKDSDSRDFTLVPVARSYDEGAWEIVAGPFSERAMVRITPNNGSSELLWRIKIFGDQYPSDSARYYLMSFEEGTKKTEKERRSKFLMQATFGPTQSDISAWPHSNGTAGFAQWIRSQINVPMTSHRSYFRTHSDWAMNNAEPGLSTIIPQHPCQKYSRWRDYAFGGGDSFKPFIVSEQNVGDEIWHLIVVDKEPRTVMKKFPGGLGMFQFCVGVMEGIGSPVSYMRQGEYSLSFEDQCLLTFQNPEIVLPVEVLDTDRAKNTSSLQYLDLPPITDFEKIEGVKAIGRDNYSRLGASLRMMVKNVIGKQCTRFTNNFQNIIGLTMDGKQLHYLGYASLQENTIDKPLPGGGAGLLPFNNQGLTKMRCANVPMDFTNVNSCRLHNGTDGCQNEAYRKPFPLDSAPVQRQNVVLCGSSGEVANDVNLDAEKTNMFRFTFTSSVPFFLDMPRQKYNVWYITALYANDQLRQRIAWALAQILVITYKQIDESESSTEIFLNYYDIFVRNAFGNYRDILKEISYSPMMGEMLTFLHSKSASWVKFWEGRDSRPDENFSREIMQLFTVGVEMLHPNGSIVRDTNGTPVPTYDNTDIQTFARAWTGFERQVPRGNVEGFSKSPNRIDPMVIVASKRDPFPKLDLNRDYIGDRYPLCANLPPNMFLRIGATYRLLGSHDLATLHNEPIVWARHEGLERLLLNTNSKLREKLCNADGNGNCKFPPQVQLDANIECSFDECKVDNLRVLQVQSTPPIYYEYIGLPCVELAFDNKHNLRKVVDVHGDALCLNTNIDNAAGPICCTSSSQEALILCKSTMERTSYKTAFDRCIDEIPDARGICDWRGIHSPEIKCNNFNNDNKDYRASFWTDKSCSTKAKVNNQGMIAIVHNPNLDIDNPIPRNQKVKQSVEESNANFFKIVWGGDENYPQSSNACGSGSCQSISDDTCLCDVIVKYSQVFHQMPTLKQIKQKLRIGAVRPDAFDNRTFMLDEELSNEDVDVYSKRGEPALSNYTIFGIHQFGKSLYLANIVSTVAIDGTPFTFRNTPHFINLVNPEARDAHYETDAVLDHYFHHQNIAPFLARRLIKRFGFSNPSPNYIQRVAQAFRTGRYKSFGNGERGNLEATIAAILLDRDARSSILEKDAGNGSFREPILKLIGFMRAMSFEQHRNAPELRLMGLSEGIGQDAHSMPNIFSFFLPEYAAPGQISDASLTSPEAQVINSPTTIGILNGILSLIDIGLSNCFGGFGDRTSFHCSQEDLTKDHEVHSHGLLRFSPSSTYAGDIVDELALLLTAGSLNPTSRLLIQHAYEAEAEASSALKALHLAQKLVVTTPEFHSASCTFDSQNRYRPEVLYPKPSKKAHKAIVFVNLNGGMDGFNMLVPMDGCGSSNIEQQYQEARVGVALDPKNLLEIDALSSNQICKSFGLHQSLPDIKKMFDSKDLLFIANIGVLASPSDKRNYTKTHKMTSLFAHDTQSHETATIDIFDEYTGRGVAGRLLDVLAANNRFSTGAVSVSGASPPIVSSSTPTIVINPTGYEQFNPSEEIDIVPFVKKLNNATNVGSSFFGDKWSDSLHHTLATNALLYDEYKDTTVHASFAVNHTFGAQMQAVSRMIQTKDIRGVDRDVFYVNFPAWDMHFNLAGPLSANFKVLNDGLKGFKEEMVFQEKWDDVTVVLVTEFGRTLQGNGGKGSDHGWGNNIFVAGGAIDGGKIIGMFPELTNDKPLVFKPGIIVPTTPWESLWNGVAEWFGAENEDDLSYVLPNRKRFQNLLFSKNTLYTAA